MCTTKKESVMCHFMVVLWYIILGISTDMRVYNYSEKELQNKTDKEREYQLSNMKFWK